MSSWMDIWSIFLRLPLACPYLFRKISAYSIFNHLKVFEVKLFLLELRNRQLLCLIFVFERFLILIKQPLEYFGVVLWVVLHCFNGSFHMMVANKLRQHLSIDWASHGGHIGLKWVISAHSCYLWDDRLYGLLMRLFQLVELTLLFSSNGSINFEPRR